MQIRFLDIAIFNPINMRIKFQYLIILLLTLNPTATKAQIHCKLQVSEDNRYLEDQNGNPVFLNGDTGWKLGIVLNQEDIQHYLDVRKSQDFNIIGMAALFEKSYTNVNGQTPMEKTNGKWDPAKPLVTDEYDYWDHIDFAINEVEKRNMFVAFVISFNSWVVGNGRGQNRDDIVFNEEKAYIYGNWIGNRYRDKKHIIWMMGGDRSPVYGQFDYQSVYHSMAEGVADGINGVKEYDGQADYSGILISYHPQKSGPASSTWFHDAPWLTFNSIQACPSVQEELIRSDLDKKPEKPTWLFEGRYEHYTYAYKPWHARFQAYLSIFAGGFGHVYGNEAIWDFDPTWKTDLFWDGAISMKYLNHIFTDGLTHSTFNELSPNNEILANKDKGITTSECWNSSTMEAPYSNRIVALANTGYTTVLVYSADGSSIEIKHDLLPGSYQAYWYNPRTGRWSERKEIIEKKPIDETRIFSNEDATMFDPPGNPGFDNDWILLLEAN